MYTVNSTVFTIHCTLAVSEKAAGFARQSLYWGEEKGAPVIGPELAQPSVIGLESGLQTSIVKIPRGTTGIVANTFIGLKLDGVGPVDNRLSTD